MICLEIVMRQITVDTSSNYKSSRVHKGGNQAPFGGGASEYPIYISLIFVKYSVSVNLNFKNNQFSSLHKQRNPFGVNICTAICKRTLSVPEKRTVNHVEQIMSKDKYQNIFYAPNGGYCVHYP